MDIFQSYYISYIFPTVSRFKNYYLHPFGRTDRQKFRSTATCEFQPYQKMQGDFIGESKSMPYCQLKASWGTPRQQYHFFPRSFSIAVRIVERDVNGEQRPENYCRKKLLPGNHQLASVKTSCSLKAASFIFQVLRLCTLNLL